MPIPGEHAVVLERNKMVQNRMRRLLAVSGLRVATADEPEQVAALLEPGSILCADAFDAELVLRHLRAQPGLRAWMWTAEPLDRLLKIAVEEPRVSNLFGRANFESTPRDWELLYAARRVLRPDDPPPFSAMLNWGYVGFKELVRTPTVASARSSWCSASSTRWAAPSGSARCSASSRTSCS